MPNQNTFVRPSILKLKPYVPGEQPRIKGLIKLNTNENPYPPSPKVLEAVRRSVDSRLRLYPNPTAGALRERLAQMHGVQPGEVFVGNGSDEILALAVRAFVEPALGDFAKSDCSLLQYFTPGYSLYPVLGEIHGTRVQEVELETDYSIPGEEKLKKDWNRYAALSLITTPNAPSGRGYSTASLEELCSQQKGVVLLDEAYAEFAEENAMSLAVKHPNVLVARTFSKAYSLCFQRMGYCVGNAELIDALDRIRDSYNVNGLGQIAALETLKDLSYYEKLFRELLNTRSWTAKTLQELGFEVLPSQTNFLFVKPPVFSATEWLEKYRDQKILVRWFSSERLKAFLRITIGSPKEMEQLLKVTKLIIQG